MKKQRGSLLVEILIVVTIVGILGAIAVPNVRDLLLRKDIEAARDTLVQTLKLARHQAMAENTIVEVSLSGHLVKLTPRNNTNNVRSVLLPERIKMVSASNIETIDLAFNATGTISNADISVIIRSSHDAKNTIQETVPINAIGSIAGM